MTKQEYIKQTATAIFDIFTDRNKNDIVVEVLEKNLNELIKEVCIDFSEWEFTYGGNVISLSKQYDLFIKQQMKIIIKKEDLDEKLCDYCPLEKKGVYSSPGGYKIGCEGSHCNEAYGVYLESTDIKQQKK